MLGVLKNQWSKAQLGYPRVNTRNFSIYGLVLYLPLWHPELNGSTITSKDLNAISCTVTGATHNPPTSRTFDGASDKISIGAPTALNFAAGDFSVLGWANPSSKATDLAVFGTTDATTRRRISLRSNAFSRTENDGTMAEVYPNAGVSGTGIDADTWTHLAGVYNSTDSKIYSYKNGGGEQSAAADGTLDAATANYVGADPSGGADQWWFPQYIGEVWVYSRALIAIEVLHIYNATKWRYL